MLPKGVLVKLLPYVALLALGWLLWLQIGESARLEAEKAQVKQALVQVNKTLAAEYKRQQETLAMLAESRTEVERIQRGANALRDELQSAADSCAARPVEPGIAERVRAFRDRRP